MPDPVLYRMLLERIGDHPIGVQGGDDLVLAAFDGDESLAAELAGTNRRAKATLREPREQARPPAVSLRSIEVEGFRGVGPRVRLDLEPGPGLTLVVGRNGSGKSSLAEALEMLLTGANRRWETRSRVWTDGWRNLHHDRVAIGATFCEEGRHTSRRLLRTWAGGAELAGGTLEIDGRTAAGLDALGWEPALQGHRPYLSHSELGRILDDGPTKLYDTLAGLLGLEDITDAQNRLAVRRRRVDAESKDAAALIATMRPLLDELDDPRATAVGNGLRAKPWDLDAVETVLSGGITATDGTELHTLRTLAALHVPDRGVVRHLVGQMQEAAGVLTAVRGTRAGEALETARLLESALAFHRERDEGGSDCPVCGGTGALTYEWRLATLQRVEDLRTQARMAQTAHERAAELQATAAGMLGPPPAVLATPGMDGIPLRDALDAWRAWAAGLHVEPAAGGRTDALAELAAHMKQTHERLLDTVAEVRAAAAGELAHREDLWKPVAVRLLEWLPLARQAQRSTVSLPQLRAAEAWLKDAHNDLRDQRFAPVALQVQENWTELRRDSNVTLAELRLEGSSNQRRLTLDASVDGQDGAALGVMSQGELNCLALSLFLPRASMPESPFHFLVIDDPVQAMDPAKVEGLARVLERTARRRQVLVFTHDDRLARAVRQLEVPATIIEVTRRENSVIELRATPGPVRD